MGSGVGHHFFKTMTGWEKLLTDMDVVVNLSGEGIGNKRWTALQKKKILSSRIQAGKAIIDAIKVVSKNADKFPKTLVQVSAIGYYGPSRDEEIVETTSPGKDFLARVCVDWENSTKEAEDFGIRRIIIRTGLVLSKGGGVLARILLPFRLFAGGPIGSGKQWYSWIHIRDEVEAIRFLVESESASGAYNLTAPNPLTNAEFGRQAAKALHRPYWLSAPAAALRLALGEMSTLVLDGQKVLPKRLVEAGFQFNYTNLDSALQELVGGK